LSEAEQKKHKLIKEYFGIHSSYSLPSKLRGRTLKVYKNEQKRVLKYINKLIP